MAFSINTSRIPVNGIATSKIIKHTSRRMASSSTTSSTTEKIPSWGDMYKQLPNSLLTMTRLPDVKQREFAGEQPVDTVVFYRDNSSWCPYCQRVWIQLEEKKIPYRVEKINMRCYGEKPAWYLKMVPSGLLPALELNGQVLTESLDIMMALEQHYPHRNPLMPPKGSSQADQVDKLLKLERKLVGAWLSRLRSFWASKGQFESVMDEVDSALAQFGGPYFLGKNLSLVDAVYAPFLERISASMPYWQGVGIRGESRWPNLQTWFDSMDRLPSYQQMKSDDFTITHTLEPQIGPCRSLPEGEAYRAKINGKDNGWDLPLKLELTAWGRDDGNGESSKLEAASALVKNHEAVVSFALRGLVNGEVYRGLVDYGLRYVAYALMVGLDNVEPLSKDEIHEQVGKAAGYLRDRVGVPRDMSYPAARQLRAHLRWFIKSLGYTN